jgi:MoxR-like ATPase
VQDIDTTAGDALGQINQLLADVNHSAPSVSKYGGLEGYLADLTGLPSQDVYVSYISKAGNFTVRMNQSRRVQRARLVVGLLGRPDDIPATVDAARRFAAAQPTGVTVVILAEGPAGWLPVRGIEPAGHPGAASVLRSFLPGLQIETYPFTSMEAATPDSGPAAQRIISQQAAITPLALDARTKRMFRTAVATYRAVMLVGPPGTGKTAMVEEMQGELLERPEQYGMSMPHLVTTVTPDESWTTRDLVGGDSVDDNGHIRFAKGYVLQAIEDDTWLMLDEANRADLDRIFGGLLTWLAGQTVTVGRIAPGSLAEVRLGWASGTVSRVVRPGDEDAPESAVEYLAGEEWRLIGTYNSLDAQRVFRLGLALGRRFAQVPVPPPTPERFCAYAEEHVAPHLPEAIRDQALSAMCLMYTIHARTQATSIGPALFLALPGYITRGVQLRDTATCQELLAEAYLASFGPWLCRLEQEVQDELGAALSAGDVLGTEWEWVRDQLRHLAGQ